MVLLVVDTQKLITNENLYKFNKFVSNVEKIIATARQNNIEIIYVRHDDGAENELTKGTEGFEIYEKFIPSKEEKIFDKKVNSAFKNTGLLEYLISKGEKDIIIVGLQTDYCIDATIKCGFEHGFHMIVPAYSNTTVENKFMSAEQTYRYYNEFIWNGRYAECIPLEQALKMMR
ncbi:cysteine hydrolase [Clostridium botulinum]|uniref:cysteine hydrolase family protein n=1 Tax=unclassified Clostridium TaxID=2614128 RepID=UPI000506C3C6|nr:MULTISPECIES: cysteine hydrolase family protein [unclassified Clostridium]AIY78625.1 isochorismatase family protein [Clostridium botulinum 202F]KAI3346019.1 cysteine hydrolase [Clostridium botulinum]KFX55381.1 amidase [Clostridium botulinum]KFX55966.1 amidase [Clostridium botulinum]KON13416.1 amidase [Clostridium botulinum]